MAESYAYVDVPFEPNDHWIPLTTGQEILVREAQCDGSSYHFRIETRPQGGRPMGLLQVGEPLPDRMVVDRQLIGADGKPVEPHHFTHLPAPIAGSGSGGGSRASVRSFRFTIAVHPVHRKVPFVLEDIPLPLPEP